MLNGLIVSCQAVKGEPLYGCHVMGLMAKAAVEGGATAIRTSGTEDIADVKKNVSVPVIGLIKKCYSDSEIYITPTMEEVKALCESKAEIIALDMTARKRPHGEKIENLIDFIRTNFPDKEILADISTESEALNAEKLGVDYISTTMRGYTSYTANDKIPDISLIKKLLSNLKTPLIAEGGIWEVGQLEELLKMGVKCVVIGTAVTRPKDITARFRKVFDKAEI